MKHSYRTFFVFCFDIVMTVLAWLCSLMLYSNFALIELEKFTFLPCFILIQSGAFYICGLYRGIWRFASIPDIVRIFKSVAIGAFGIALSIYTLNIYSLESPVIIIYAMILMILLSVPRLLVRYLKDRQTIFKKHIPVLIVGAGAAGESLVRALTRSQTDPYKPMAFIDDDKNKWGKEIQGIPVKGSCEKIPEIVKQLNLEMVIIAIPSASSQTMRRIIDICSNLNLSYRTIPSLKELNHAGTNINALRNVTLDDLLGREQVDIDWKNLSEFLENKTVLVTGGGGSIGSELCLQIAKFKPNSLIIVEHSEYNLYNIDFNLKKQFPDLKLYSYLSSITNKNSIEEIFEKHKPEFVLHAAAYKHVPLLETQIKTAIQNNVAGTMIVAKTAIKFSTKTFVLISTDKAVRPTNIMGATKRTAEVICQQLNETSKTQFITVRFGNVLGSSGSVIPLFRKQLETGGPITVTHPDVTRFFMTILEACQLILQAASIGKGGEIFVLDMGEPIKIKYLAEQFIKSSGHVIGKDIAIEYIGLRPGEKLQEELFYENESLCKTQYRKIFTAQGQHNTISNDHSYEEIINKIYHMEDFFHEKNLLNFLFEFVPEYKSHCLNRPNEYYA